jgi:hypothetical protein
VAGSSETISARKGSGHGVSDVNLNGGAFEGKRCVSSVGFAASDCVIDGKSSERCATRRLLSSAGSDGQALVHSSSSYVLSANLAPRVILQVIVASCL